MKKKIALFTTKEGALSGVTVFMDLIHKELRRRGYDAELIRPVPTAFKSVIGFGYILGYALTRERLKDFDLIMGNGVGLTGAVDLPVKIIDNIHSTSSGSNRVFTQAIKDLTQTEKTWLDYVLKPLLGQGHEDILGSLATKQTAFEVDKVVAQRADAIVTVSPATRQEVIDFFEVGDMPVDVVPNGVEERWFAPRAYDELIERDAVNVVHTGRAGVTTINVFWKGFDRVLAVLGSVKGATPVGIFHLGNAASREAYGELLEKAGVAYRFDVENENLPTYLRAGDIYVQTSRYEACSLSIMEAMASGLAPVAFPSGMVRKQIKDGENGFIVETIEEMQARVQELIDNPELRISMGKAAARTMKEEYSVEKMVEGYISVIERLLA